MSHEPKILGITGGAVALSALALAFGTCCAAPWAHYWNGYGWVYAWDAWLIYPPDAAWNGAAPPEPAFLMHQLGGLPHTAQFPHLNARVFAAKVHAMVDSLGQTALSK